MTDTLKSRVGRIVAGSVSALVGAIEDATPEMIMEGAIAEIDHAIADVQGDLGKCLAARHVATRQLEDKKNKHRDLAEKIRLAVDSGRDDLAKVGISAQLDIEAQLPLIEQAIADSSQQELELGNFVTALRGKKREMQDELAEFRAGRKASANQEPAATAGQKAAIASQIFERAMSKHGSLATLPKSDLTSVQKLGELEVLVRDNCIKERLAKMKAEQN
jgi:phage shock protein A